MPQVIDIVPQTPPEIKHRALLRDQKSVADVSAAEHAPAAGRPPTFALYTLGCKVNQYDSHQISRALVQRGFRRVEFRESADLYVIDTCTVTAEADRKSRKAAGRARRNNPDAVVAVTGCAASYSAEQFYRVVPDALVLDHWRKTELPDLALLSLQERADWAANYALYREQMGSEPSPVATRERAVLKIQDGCNHRCAFCIIPTVRGASVTKSQEIVMSEARAFVREGARELIVTGVSMGDWGRADDRRQETENGERHGGRNGELCTLLRSLTTIEGLERLRVSSLDPADVDEEFLQTVAYHPLICPHIHLALQSGAASTLRRMRRRYTPDMFLKWAKRWREIRPDGGLTTDIIVGFPGETDEEFEASLQMAREARFSAIHVFPYSPRSGTAAADLPGLVPPAVQSRRVNTLLELASQLSGECSSRFIGQTLPVLIETITGDRSTAEGLTPHYVRARVALPPDSSAAAGDICGVQINGWRDGVLEGAWQS